MIIFANSKTEIKRLYTEFIKKYPLISKFAIFYDEGLKHSIFIENQIDRIAFKHIKNISFENAENAIDDILNECRIEDLYCIPCAVAGLCILIER